LNGLSFVHPGYLWALAGLALPVIVHFLNRARSRRLDFSTLRFFSTGAKATSRLRKIKRLLLLLVRMAALCALVAVFSKPYSTKDPFAVLGNPDATVFAFVDPTISMEYLDAGEPLWKKARFLLDTLDKMLPSAARRSLFDETASEFVPVRSFGSDPGVVPRHGRAPVEKMALALAHARSRATSMPALVILSDFQENISGSLDTLLSRCGTTPVLCVGLAPRSPWNYSVAGVSVSAIGRTAVTARVACRGKRLDSTGISVLAGGMRVGHALVSAVAGQSVIVPVVVTSDMRNPCGAVTLDCDDPFSQDNTCFFIHGASTAMRVLVVGEPEESFPVIAAFGALGASQWDPVMRQGHAVSYGDIDSASLVVLCGIRQLSPPLAVFLRSRLFGQKAIMFFPAADSALAGRSAAVLPVNNLASCVPASDGKRHAVVLPDTVSRLFSGFRRLKDEDAAVSWYLSGLPGTALCMLDNGRAFATHMLDTLGNSWVMLAAPLGTGKGGGMGEAALFETGIFVPLIDRLARYSLSAIQKEPRPWTAGIAQRNPFFGAKRGAMVFDAEGRAVARWSGQPLVAFATPGHYRILPDGEASYWVAAGLDTMENNFVYRPPRIGANKLPPIKYLASDELQQFVKARRAGSFSQWFWVALALLFIAEIFLWEKRPPQPGPVTKSLSS
jgi:hypothetical protein